MELKNSGYLDRGVRVALGIGLLAAGWSGAVTGNAGMACKILGFIPLVTGLVGICPLYLPLGLSTRGGK